VDLVAEEIRVLGCLVEKHLTTPQQYPLTLNALLAACNQASNRDPVVEYDQRTVDSAVASLKDKGLVHFDHPSHGRSATRYRHGLDEVLDLDIGDLALMAMLAVRGPQTPGELRARTERMASFSNSREVEERLDALASRPDPLAVRMAREPGRREFRYTHLLGSGGGADASSAGHVSLPESGAGKDDASLASLTAEVARLRAEVESLRNDVAELKAGPPSDLFA
jgi:uncharacterized protein